jgi:hypothetical protein
MTRKLTRSATNALTFAGLSIRLGSSSGPLGPWSKP